MALRGNVEGACSLAGCEGVERTTVTGAGVKESGNFGGSEMVMAWTPVSRGAGGEVTAAGLVESTSSAPLGTLGGGAEGWPPGVLGWLGTDREAWMVGRNAESATSQRWVVLTSV